MTDYPQIGDRVKGTTTSYSHPRETEVEGTIVAIDPKPAHHPRKDTMYYAVKIDSQPSWVYILSDIPRTE